MKIGESTVTSLEFILSSQNGVKNAHYIILKKKVDFGCTNEDLFRAVLVNGFILHPGLLQKFQWLNQCDEWNCFLPRRLFYFSFFLKIKHKTEV